MIGGHGYMGTGCESGIKLNSPIIIYVKQKATPGKTMVEIKAGDTTADVKVNGKKYFCRYAHGKWYAQQ